LFLMNELAAEAAVVPCETFHPFDPFHYLLLE
jgi:hypothetical protein